MSFASPVVAGARRAVSGRRWSRCGVAAASATAALAAGRVVAGAARRRRRHSGSGSASPAWPCSLSRSPARSVRADTRAAGTVIVAMDVSNSMSATDVAPTRLDAAKKAATAFVQAQPSSVISASSPSTSGGADTTDPVPTTPRRRGDPAVAPRRRHLAGRPRSWPRCPPSPARRSRPAGRPRADLGYLGFGDDRVVFRRRGPRRPRRDNVAATLAAERRCAHRDGRCRHGRRRDVEVDGYRIHSALDDDTLTTIAKTTAGRTTLHRMRRNSTGLRRRSIYG